MNKTTFCATSCIGENKEFFFIDAFETMVGSASWTLRAVFKLHLQATHLVVSSSRPKYLNLNTWQHTKLRARSRQPHLSQGRLERVLINLSGEDRSNPHWDTLTTVYPEKWAQDKNINSTKKLSKKKTTIPTPCHLPSETSHTKKKAITQNLLKPSMPVTFQTSEKKADKEHLKDLLLWMRSFTVFPSLWGNTHT